MDFAPNALDADIIPMLETQSHALRFALADLNKPLPVAAAYGFCADVMEHIPPAQVGRVLDNCLHAAQHVFFRIATDPDRMGVLVGHPLHLTVEPYAWWAEQFRQRECVIHFSADRNGYCVFYVSAWVDGPTLAASGELNTSEEAILANVSANLAGGWPQVEPHVTNNLEVMILGGGPSLARHLPEIRRKRAAGVKLVALNGAYNWCLENGLTPSAQIIVDARPFNARFTHPVVDECKYLLASQVHPSVLEGLPPERTLLWHTSNADIEPLLKAKYEVWWPVPGGSTVLLRAIPLLRMLGFRRFHLYGCDSCLEQDAHHAYDQPENEGAVVIPVNVVGKIFHCHPWMVAQAQELCELIRFLGSEFELKIFGDGLLAHILETGAALAKEV